MLHSTLVDSKKNFNFELFTLAERSEAINCYDRVSYDKRHQLKQNYFFFFIIEEVHQRFKPVKPILRKITKFTINQQKFDSELQEAIRAKCQQNFRVIELDEGKGLRIQLETILFRSQETEFKFIYLCLVQDKVTWIEVIHQSRCTAHSVIAFITFFELY